MKNIRDCARFQAWCAEMEKQGVTVRILREARSQPRGPYDLYLVTFTGHGFQPRHLTGMIQFFAKDGFQVYYPPQDQTVTGDVELLKSAA